jgi:hypothetical protein
LKKRGKIFKQKSIENYKSLTSYLYFNGKIYSYIH